MTAKLIGVNQLVCNDIMLHPLSYHLLKELAHGFEQRDRPVSFREGVIQLVGLGDGYYLRFLPLGRVVPHLEAGIEHIHKVVFHAIPSFLQEAPVNARGAWCALIGHGFQEGANFHLTKGLKGLCGLGRGVIMEVGWYGRAFFHKKLHREESCHRFVIVDQTSFHIEEGWDVRGASAMSPGHNFPDVSGHDVLVGPVTLGLSYDLLQVFVGCACLLLSPETPSHVPGRRLALVIPPS
jgi:hypothetical protein